LVMVMTAEQVVNGTRNGGPEDGMILAEYPQVNTKRADHGEHVPSRPICAGLSCEGTTGPLMHGRTYCACERAASRGGWMRAVGVAAGIAQPCQGPAGLSPRALAGAPARPRDR
jgi:hypothetical protein